MNWVRDGILIVVAVGLLVAVFLPSESPQNVSDTDNRGDTPGDGARASAQDGGVPSTSTSTVQPLTGVFHNLFPLVDGVAWTYLVTGSGDGSLADQWTMKVVKAPTADAAGVIEMGFDGDLSEKQVRLADGSLQIWGLPYHGAVSYLGSEGYDFGGKWLPAMKYIVNDAVWEYTHRRNVRYRSRGKDRRIHEEAAVAIQTDRAQMRRQEKVIVPAGVFEAYLVSWTSRMEIRAGKQRRKVLQKLTTEPFRRETVWLAPAVGMVRRRVVYEPPHKQDIIFELVKFEHP